MRGDVRGAVERRRRWIDAERSALVCGWVVTARQ
jgi:hypothetical protein